MNLRLITRWNARHDNGWTTYVLERSDGAFCGGAAANDANPIVLDRVEWDLDAAKTAAESALKDKTGHAQCSATCTPWEAETQEVDVWDERSTENRRSKHAPPPDAEQR